MAIIKKKCCKCGEKIEVDEYGFCCPKCGEFFEDITNEKVIKNHSAQQREFNTESKHSRLIEESKDNFKKAYRKFFSIWGDSFGIALAFGFFAPLTISFVLSIGIIIMILFPIVYYLTLPFRLIIIKKKIAKEQGKM